MTVIELLVLFLALGLGGLGGFASAYAVHWVLIHRMRGIDGLLRANYAIAKRAENKKPVPAVTNGELTEADLWARAHAQGLFIRGE